MAHSSSLYVLSCTILIMSMLCIVNVQSRSTSDIHLMKASSELLSNNSIISDRTTNETTTAIHRNDTSSNITKRSTTSSIISTPSTSSSIHSLAKTFFGLFSSIFYQLLQLIIDFAGRIFQMIKNRFLPAWFNYLPTLVQHPITKMLAGEKGISSMLDWHWIGTKIFKYLVLFQHNMPNSMPV